MPRGANHHHDDDYLKDLYRQFDLDDLTRFIGWVRAIKQPSFTAQQIRALSDVTTGGNRFGVQRVRRVLRVGVEIGWLRLAAGEFQITDSAIATLPPFAPVIRDVARDVGRSPEEAHRIYIDHLKRVFQEATA